MEIKIKFILVVFIFSFLSCNEKRDINSLKEQNRQVDNSIIENKVIKSEILEKDNLKHQAPEISIENNKSNLGEDLAEINCYVKKIYQKNNLTYVDIDVVEVNLTPEGDRTIINKNPKIRTYVVDKNTIIYLRNCDSATPEELLKMDKNKLEDKSIIVVGSSKDGVLESLNFGCYG